METIPIEKLIEMVNNLKNKFNCFTNIAINIRGFEQTEIDYYLYVEDVFGEFSFSVAELELAYKKLMAQKENKSDKI